jgi:hypothetical protein
MVLDLTSKLFGRSSSGLSAKSPIARAQNFSVTKLQQQTDRDNAKVSISQATQAKQAGGGATTSIAHSGEESVLPGDDVGDDEVRDRLRWQHIRRIMQEKKAAEVAASQVEPSKYEVPGMGTGSVFARRSPAWQSAERQLYKKVRQERATLKNIDAKDRKYFLDVVEGHAKKLMTGVGFGRSTRKKMKFKIEKDRQKGVVSKADASDFKKMIDELPH